MTNPSWYERPDRVAAFCELLVDVEGYSDCEVEIVQSNPAAFGDEYEAFLLWERDAAW